MRRHIDSLTHFTRARGWRRTLSVTLALALALTSCPVSPTVWAALNPSRPASDSDTPLLNLRRLDLTTFSVPKNLGSVVERWQPSGRQPTGFVIHFQDLHTQQVTQQAIAQLIDAVRRSTGVSLVALEGGAGPGETEFFSAFPDQETNQQLADFFLEQGLFTGPVAYAVTHPGLVTLYGVEDPTLYLEHLEAYQTGHPRQRNKAPYIKALLTTLRELEDQLYTRALRTLMATAGAYKEQTIGLAEYAQALSRLATQLQLALAPYPNVTRLLRIIDLEREIDLPAVSEEHQQLVATLTERLEDPDAQSLLAHQLTLLTGKLSKAQYYHGLERFARTAGLPYGPSSSSDVPPATNPYANVMGYTEVLLLSEELSHPRIPGELHELLGAIKDRLFATPDQRQLDQLMTAATVLQGLYEFRLMRDRLAYYQTHPSHFTAQPFLSFLERHHRLTPDLRRAVVALFEDLATLERFYDIAFRRDEALVANTLSQMERQEPSAAILVAGGFHSQGITQRLREQDVAYVVIAPKVTGGGVDEERYSAFLFNRVPSLEELVREFSKDMARGHQHRAHGDVLSQPIGIFPSDIQGTVEQSRQPSVGRTREDQAPSQSKRRYLREVWTHLKTVLLSLRGWSPNQIEAAYATHPTLTRALGFAIKPDGEDQVEVVINGTVLTYQPQEGSAVEVVSVQHEPPEQALQVAGARALPVGSRASADNTPPDRAGASLGGVGRAARNVLLAGLVVGTTILGDVRPTPTPPAPESAQAVQTLPDAAEWIIARAQQVDYGLLLLDTRVLLLGEAAHNRPTLLLEVPERLDELRAAGVTHIGHEFFSVDAQDDIDAYLDGQATLETVLRHLGPVGRRTGGALNSKARWFERARELGIRVVALDIPSSEHERIDQELTRVAQALSESKTEDEEAALRRRLGDLQDQIGEGRSQFMAERINGVLRSEPSATFVAQVGTFHALPTEIPRYVDAPVKTLVLSEAFEFPVVRQEPVMEALQAHRLAGQRVMVLRGDTSMTETPQELRFLQDGYDGFISLPLIQRPPPPPTQRPFPTPSPAISTVVSESASTLPIQEKEFHQEYQPSGRRIERLILDLPAPVPAIQFTVHPTRESRQGWGSLIIGVLGDNGDTILESLDVLEKPGTYIVSLPETQIRSVRFSALGPLVLKDIQIKNVGEFSMRPSGSIAQRSFQEVIADRIRIYGASSEEEQQILDVLQRLPPLNAKGSQIFVGRFNAMGDWTFVIRRVVYLNVFGDTSEARRYRLQLALQELNERHKGPHTRWSRDRHAAYQQLHSFTETGQAWLDQLPFGFRPAVANFEDHVISGTYFGPQAYGSSVPPGRVNLLPGKGMETLAYEMGHAYFKTFFRRGQLTVPGHPELRWDDGALDYRAEDRSTLASAYRQFLEDVDAFVQLPEAEVGDAIPLQRWFKSRRIDTHEIEMRMPALVTGGNIRLLRGTPLEKYFDQFLADGEFASYGELGSWYLTLSEQDRRIVQQYIDWDILMEVERLANTRPEFLVPLDATRQAELDVVFATKKAVVQAEERQQLRDFADRYPLFADSVWVDTNSPSWSMHEKRMSDLHQVYPDVLREHPTGSRLVELFEGNGQETGLLGPGEDVRIQTMPGVIAVQRTTDASEPSRPEEERHPLDVVRTVLGEEFQNQEGRRREFLIFDDHFDEETQRFRIDPLRRALTEAVGQERAQRLLDLSLGRDELSLAADEGGTPDDRAGASLHGVGGLREGIGILSPAGARAQVMQTVLLHDPILAQFDPIVTDALEALLVQDQPRILLFGSEILKTPTGLAALMTLRQQIDAGGARGFINLLYVHTDQAISEDELFARVGLDGGALFDGAVSAVEGLGVGAPDMIWLQSLIVAHVNLNLEAYSERTGRMIERIEALTPRNTVTFAGNAKGEPVSGDESTREDRIFLALVNDAEAVHVQIAQPAEVIRAEAVAHSSLAVAGVLAAWSETPAPVEVMETVEQVRAAIRNGGRVFVKPFEDDFLAEFDREFRAHQLIETQG